MSRAHATGEVDLATLRTWLEPVAARGETRTYQQVAAGLGLEPPNTIHRVTQALERLMAEDAAAGRPLLAAVVISRTRQGLPAPGFFARARELGCYDGPGSGPQAARWHAAERERLRHGYGAGR